ncbi:mCG147628 [Mus musculus]|nr:mCG147628 [Mus musculus]
MCGSFQHGWTLKDGFHPVQDTRLHPRFIQHEGAEHFLGEDRPWLCERDTWKRELCRVGLRDMAGQPPEQ